MRTSTPARSAITVLVMFALATLLAACGGSDVEKADAGDYDQTVKMKLAYNPTVPESSLLASALQRTNIDELWGLDLEMVPFSTSAETVSALASGSIDVYWTGDGPLGGAMNQGLPFTVIGENSGWIQGIAVPEDSDIETIADLKGRKVGTHEGNTLSTYVRDMVEQAGVDPDDVDWVNVPITEQQAVFADGGIDAVVSWSPTLYQFPGVRYIYEEAAGVGRPYPANVLAVQDKLAQDNNEAVVRVLAAIMQANWWVNENLDEAKGWYIDETNIDPALLDTMLELSPTIEPDEISEIDVAVTDEHIERMTRTAALFAAADGEKESVDYADVTDNGFAEEARERFLERGGDLDIKVEN